MKKPLFLLQLLVFAFGTKAYSQKINVEFISEGKLQNLASDFSIYFVWTKDSAKYIVKPFVKNNSFLLPDMKGIKQCDIVFKYRNKIVACSISTDISVDCTFRFGIDLKPFEESYNIEGVDDLSVKGVSYLMLMPLKGEGIATTILILNLKEYQRSCYKLIN